MGRGGGERLTGAVFLVKALSHKSLMLPVSHFPKPLHCLDLLGFARGKPTPVRGGEMGREGERGGADISVNSRLEPLINLAFIEVRSP